MKFFVVCPRGLELPLYEEVSAIVDKTQNANYLHSLGLDPMEIKQLQNAFKATQLGTAPIKPSGGIEISGPFELASLLNLYSRIASRVLLQLVNAPYKKEEDIYQVANQISWEDWFTVDQTLRVDVTSQRSTLQSINFITLRIKDAICDRFREIKGKRPSIETATPDVRVMAFLDQTHVSIYMDTSGEPLFKRGYRDEKGEAPLKENLAAGILHLTGWNASQPLFDPMCGSGTFLIEAGQMAKGIPAGAIRAGILSEVTELSEETKPSDIIEPIDSIETHKSKKPTQSLSEQVPTGNVNPEPQSQVSKPSSPTPSKWVAPIAVDSGKPVMRDTSGDHPVRPRALAHSIQQEVQESEAHPKKKFAAYRPTRVDLVGSFQGFGFLRLKPYQAKKEQAIWEFIKMLASKEMQRAHDVPLLIAGSDIGEPMVKMVKRNWRKAHLPGEAVVRQIDALQAKSPFPDRHDGVMLFNPPYGERIEIKGGKGGSSEDENKKQRGARDPLPKNITDPEFVEFLAAYGRHLKEQFDGWQIDVLTADMGLPGQLRMKEEKRTPLFNGAIECRLFRFTIRKLETKT